MLAKNKKEQEIRPKGNILNGYTLIEALLSVVVISLIAGFSVPIYQIFQNKNDLDIAANGLANTIRKAQFFSMSGKGDDDWSVRIENGQIILFKGSDFSSREQIFDELFEISPTINFSGDQEFIFEKLSGEPRSGGGAVSLISINGNIKEVSINEKGNVE